jgi:hypothetical protein
MEYGPFGDTYCVAFVRGCSPREVLMRFGVDEETVEEVSFERFDDVSWELAEERRGRIGGYVGAVATGRWTLLIEPWGCRAARDRHVLNCLCEGTEMVAISVDPYTSDHFLHAAHRDVIVSFEPARPHDRCGTAPDRWDRAMRAAGLGQGAGDPPPESPITSAFTLAGEITGVTFSRAVLSLPVLAAVSATTLAMARAAPASGLGSPARSGLPEGADRDGSHAVAEGEGLGAGVEDNADGEVVADPVGHVAEAAEVVGADG